MKGVPTLTWKCANGAGSKGFKRCHSFQIAGSVMGNVSQFRAIYPEYAAVSDEAIAHKLNQTFYPNIQYGDFSQRTFYGDTLGLPQAFLSSTSNGQMLIFVKAIGAVP
jgi:hypothetical protein